ncbi:MAG: aldose 1-epimerase family protein [Erysipelotrichales bacterium]
MKISNERFELEIINRGGEIQSFFDKKKKVEYMWQGDEKYWTGKNPTLFPIVSGLANHGYDVDGQHFEMKNHGFIRISDMICIEETTNKITMELKANEFTLEQYPYNFKFHTQYELIDNKIIITYIVLNKGKKAMPFSLGCHPGFNCPIEKNEKFSDYKLVFPMKENATQLVMDLTKTNEPEQVKRSFEEIKLNYADFEKYSTLLYKDIVSPYVDLVGPKHSIRVSCYGFKYLAVWTPDKAPFICIEPWHGHGDFTKTPVEFSKREDTIILNPGKEWKTSYSIEILD